MGGRPTRLMHACLMVASAQGVSGKISKVNRRSTMQRSSCTSALAALMFAASLGPAAAQSGVQVGVLECRGSGSISFVIGSVHEFTCLFSGAGPVQPYHGLVQKVGLDLGVTDRSVLGW